MQSKQLDRGGVARKWKLAGSSALQLRSAGSLRPNTRLRSTQSVTPLMQQLRLEENNCGDRAPKQSPRSSFNHCSCSDPESQNPVVCNLSSVPRKLYKLRGTLLGRFSTKNFREDGMVTAMYPQVRTSAYVSADIPGQSAFKCFSFIT